MKLILAKNEKYPAIFAPRNILEEDPSFRQIIPYVVIKNENGEYALFQRYKGNEKRLSGKKTIGLGGHVDLSDVFSIFQYKEKIENSEYKEEEFVNEILISAMQREIKEEIGYHSFYIKDFVFLGEIKIDNTLVDSVHIGFVYTVNLNSQTLLNCYETIKEKELVFLGFRSKEELKKEEGLENWSKFVLENII